ncbi:MAG: hypothetical protein Q9227_002591 [Pyrenula ochraceoflavens]
MAVMASCGTFWVLLEYVAGGRLRTGLFALATVLACIEKLCAVGNLVSVERDWVVILTEGNERSRQVLNARMRRIDLSCKLLGPLVISLINGASTIVAIWTTLGFSAASIVVEYICIAQVYKMVPALQRSPSHNSTDPLTSATPVAALPQHPQPRPTSRTSHLLTSLRSALTIILPVQSIPFYTHHPAFLPSLSLSLLYLTVLSFSGQMITFLLSPTGGGHYTSTSVGIARTISTLFELSATWLAPRLMKRIGAVRGGIWFLAWEMAWLAGGVSWFLACRNEAEGEGAVFAASGLVGGVILSRVGLWGFDLCAQTIVQDAVPPTHRGAFSTLESSLQSLFDLLSYTSTILFPHPSQFQWPAVMSVAAVYGAGGLYAGYVRRTRGHLVHGVGWLWGKMGEREV